jgi:hypothetical protein
MHSVPQKRHLRKIRLRQIVRTGEVSANVDFAGVIRIGTLQTCFTQSQCRFPEVSVMLTDT